MILSSTEDRNPQSADLDLKSVREILEVINREDRTIQEVLDNP